MIETIITNVVEKVSFTKKIPFTQLLKKSIQEFKRTEDDEEKSDKFESIIFRVDVFFKGFHSFVNEFGKDKKYEAGVEAISCICQELGIEIDKSECFILFHLRDYGKFHVKESKLLTELKSLWGQYPEYKLEGNDFSYSLQNLRNEKMIKYRRGTLSLCPNVILRYRK